VVRLSLKPPLLCRAAAAAAIVWKYVACRLQDLAEARELVVEDEEILGGTPVIRSTRIPIHDAAAALNAAIPREGSLRMYPSLNERQISQAEVYAKAASSRGRPRKLSPPDRESANSEEATSESSRSLLK